jgi:hypothetical protein
MAETRRKSDADCREGAVRLVRETGQPIAQVARDPGTNEMHARELGERGQALAACQKAG